MPCNLSRRDVSRIVLAVIRRIQRDPTIVEASIFGPQGINADAKFRSTYFSPIKDGIQAMGDCSIVSFSPADCETASSIADIVDAAFDDLSSQANGE